MTDSLSGEVLHESNRRGRREGGRRAGVGATTHDSSPIADGATEKSTVIDERLAVINLD